MKNIRPAATATCTIDLDQRKPDWIGCSLAGMPTRFSLADRITLRVSRPWRGRGQACAGASSHSLPRPSKRAGRWHWIGAGVRALLVLSLLFASGPWTAVSASATSVHCQHAAMNQAQTLAAVATHAAPAVGAHASGSQHPPPCQKAPCGEPGSGCGSACQTFCALHWTPALPAIASLPGPPVGPLALIVAAEHSLPTTPSPAALRPPISA